MPDQTPIFEPAKDWENIKKWMQRDDAARNQLMRNAIKEELKPVVPFMQRVGRLELVVFILGVLDISTLVYLIVQS